MSEPGVKTTYLKDALPPERGWVFQHKTCSVIRGCLSCQTTLSIPGHQIATIWKSRDLPPGAAPLLPARLAHPPTAHCFRELVIGIIMEYVTLRLQYVSGHLRLRVLPSTRLHVNPVHASPSLGQGRDIWLTAGDGSQTTPVFRVLAGWGDSRPIDPQRRCCRCIQNELNRGWKFRTEVNAPSQAVRESTGPMDSWIERQAKTSPALIRSASTAGQLGRAGCSNQMPCLAARRPWPPLESEASHCGHPQQWSPVPLRLRDRGTSRGGCHSRRRPWTVPAKAPQGYLPTRPGPLQGSRDQLAPRPDFPACEPRPRSACCSSSGMGAADGGPGRARPSVRDR